MAISGEIVTSTKLQTQDDRASNGECDRSMPITPGIHLVAIAAQVDDIDTLIAGVVPGTRIIVLDATQDGVAQITQAMRTASTAISSLHIVAHGSPGCLYLGDGQLSLDTLERDTDKIQSWFAPTITTPQLHLYGCNVAAGDAGSEFLAKLHTLTGAAIAASTSPVGNAALGGSWHLDVAIGNLHSPQAFTQAAHNAYARILGFTPTTLVPVGNSPFSVVFGDFDNDSIDDMAIANINSNSVSIRLGDGSGGFSGSTNIGVGNNPHDVIVNDFNNDGNNDFLVANAGSNNVSIWLGDGTGNFSSSATVGTGNFPLSLEIADFNSDGIADFAVANLGSNSVSIRFGDGLGGTSGGTDVSVGAGPHDMAIGDFNGDGHVDLATSNSNSNTVSIRLGDGAGGFTNTPDVAAGARPVSIAIGDINGDGHADWVNANANSGTASVRLGDGTGNFSGSTEVAVGAGAYSVALGDVNLDGKTDFVVANSSGTGSVSIRYGDGLGNFSGADIATGGNGPIGIALNDVNSDGKLDIATTNISSSSVSVLINNHTDTAPVLNDEKVALDLDGANDFVALPNLGLSGNTSISVSAWINANDAVRNNIFGFGNAGQTDRVFSLRTGDGPDGQFLLYFWTTGLYVNGPSYVGQWTHVAATYDSATQVQKVFVNGVEIGSQTGTVSGTPNFVNANYRISGFNNEYFDGSIDEVGIWNRALSTTEIQTIYNENVEAVGGTLAYYSFVADSNGSTVITDQSGNNFDGALINGQGNHIITGEPVGSPIAVGLSAVNEDAAAPTGVVGTLVSDLVDLDSAGGGNDNVNDPDAGAVTGIALTAADTTNGSWFYSIDGGTNWTALGTVSDTNARLLAADANTRLYFQPNADFNGDIADAITFRAWDQTSGTAGGTADVSTNGGTTAFSAETGNASITVNAVNDAPSFTKGGDQSVAQDSGAQTVTGWASAIAAGPTDEAGQNLTFQVSNDNNALFSAQPTIDSTTGNLTYTAAAGVTGSAIVTVNIKDDGGTANGGVDTSADQTFTITVKDTTNPTVTVNIVDAVLSDTDNSSDVTFAFSEVVTGFTKADLTVEGGTITDISTIDNQNFTATFTADDNSTTDGKVTVNGGSYTDGAGNTGAEGSDTVTVDTTNPTLTSFTRQTPGTEATDANALVFRATFDEAVQNVDAADFVVNGTTATISNISGSGDTYDITVTGGDLASLNGTVGLDLAGTPSIQDLAGNALPAGEPATDQTYTLQNNTAPTTGDEEDSIAEDDIISFNSGFFTNFFNDADGDGFQGIRVTALPTKGQFFVDANMSNTQDAGETVAANDEIGLTELNQLKYIPNANGYGDNFDTFQFQVFDGTDYSTGSATFTVDVRPVNDAPVLANDTTFTAIDEDLAPASNNGNTITELLGSLVTDVDFDPQGIAVTNVDNTNGTWQYSTNGGTTWTAFGNGVTGTNAVTLGATSLYNGYDGTAPSDQSWLTLANIVGATEIVELVGTTLDTTANQGIYAGYSNYNGATLVNPDFPQLDNTEGYRISFNLQVLDDAQTNPSRAGFSLVVVSNDPTKAIEIAFQDDKIFAQDDNPLFVEDPAATVAFDTTQATQYTLAVQGNNYTLFADNTSILTGTLRDYASFMGAIDPYETPNFIFLGDDSTSAQGSFRLNQVAVETETRVRFVPDADYAGDANIQFRAWDTTDGSNNGDTGVDASQTGGENAFSTNEVTGTVTVNAVNDAPTLTSFAAPVETTNEDKPVELTLADLATQGNEADIDGTVTSFVVQAITSGTLLLGADAGSATAFATGTNDTITAGVNAYWTPDADANGTLDAFTVVAQDDQSAESTSAVTAQVSVTAVNDRPSFSATNPATNERGATAVTLANWATFAPGGGTDEASQTALAYTVSGITNASLFTVAPSISTTGELTYTLDPTVVGTSDFKVTVQDNGGTANGGVDTSASQIFTITVDDTTNPTVTVNIVDAALSDTDNSSEVTFAFSEVVTDFTKADLTVAGGTITDVTTTDNQNYTATFTADDNSTTAGSVTVNANSYTDVEGNNGSGGNDTITVDTVNPAAPSTPDMTAATDTGSSNSDNITNDTTPTFTGTAEANSTITLTSSVDGTVGTTIANGLGNWTITASTLSTGAHNITAQATDAAGNVSSASSTLGIEVDSDAPTVTVNIVDAALSDPNNSSEVTFEFSEAVTGFTEADIARAGGTLSNFTQVDGDSYKATFTADDNSTTAGALTVTVGTYSDGAGNLGASGSDTVTVDTTNPSVTAFTRKTPTAGTTDADALTFQATFTEAVQNVDKTDFEVNGTTATVTNVTGSGDTYEITVSGGDLASLNGIVGLDLAIGADIQDLAGNALPVGEPATDETYTVSNAAPPSGPPIMPGAPTAPSTTNVVFNFEQWVSLQTIRNGQEYQSTLVDFNVEIGGLRLAPLFDETDYLSDNPDVATAVQQGFYQYGFEHFVLFGIKEGRAPSDWFDADYYLAQNADVAAAVQSGQTTAIEHFLLFGHRENRDPSAFFDASDYLLKNPDVQAAVDAGLIDSAFEHYLESGAEEGRQSGLLFDESFYLAQNSDVAAAVQKGDFALGLYHFLSFGQREGRDPSAAFDQSAYLERYSDVAAAVASGAFASGFEHYVLFGRAEDRVAV